MAPPPDYYITERLNEQELVDSYRTGLI